MEPQELSGSRKAAALFVALGEDVASKLLKYLDESEIEQIGREMSVLESLPSEVAEKVLKEFHRAAISGQGTSTGGLDFAKNLLQKALGSDAKGVINRLTKSLDTSELCQLLSDADTQQLYQFIQNEHPQTIALILAHVEPSSAAVLLGTFPEALRAQISMRIANLGEISPEVIRRISSILSQKLASVGTVSRESVGGARVVAELVNKMDRTPGREILEKIEIENAELAGVIRNLMLVFEDIMLIDAPGVREILQRVDKKILTLALKGTTEELQAHIFKGMSQGASEMMREDMEVLGPVRLRDVETAQREILGVVQKLEGEGLVSIRGGGSDDYVT